MKVIFVIQGEGRGHLTQALALKQMLLHARADQVVQGFSGQEQEQGDS